MTPVSGSPPTGGEVQWRDVSTIASDPRLKRNMTEVSTNSSNSMFDTENLEKIKLVHFQYPTDPATRIRYGFRADNLKEVLPWTIVDVNDDGSPSEYLSLDYIAMIQYLTGICTVQQRDLNQLLVDNRQLKTDLYQMKSDNRLLSEDFNGLRLKMDELKERIFSNRM